MDHRRYGLTALIFFAVLFGALLLTNFFVQPFTGDLTRIGGYLENRFGWNEPQRQIDSRYDNILVRSAPERFGDPADIWVYGDSFSHTRNNVEFDQQSGTIDRSTGGRNNWADWLSATTGWSILTYSINQHSLDEILDSGGFTKHPPRVFIYETVEREAWRRLKDLAGDTCRQPSPSPAVPPLVNRSLSPLTYTATRRKHSSPADFSALFHLAKMHYKEEKDSEIVGLTIDTLFSSNNARQTLIYRGDRLKNDYPDNALETMRCGINALRSRIESNDRTRFVLLIIPDKSTAYQQFIKRFDIDNTLDGYDEELPHTVRLIGKIQAAIEAGNIDVYFPNDTHYGYIGHRVTAEAVIDHLKAEGIAR